MNGQPGSRGWAVEVQRRGLSPVTITAASVDPLRFTDALRQWRPGL